MKKLNKPQFITINIIFIFVMIIICLVSNINIHQQYKQEIINNNAKMIANIIEEHPEVEKEIIDALIDNKGDENAGHKILKKYGLDNYTNIDDMNSIKVLKKNLIVSNTVMVSIIIGFYIISLLIYYFSIKRNSNKMRKFMESVLNDKYNINFDDYDDNVLSSLKTDIYKMTIKLRNMAEYSNNEKKYLETTLSDISHQLKTPLTSLFVFNEILSQDKLDEKQRKEVLEKIEIQLDRIKWLITSLLKMSQLDSGSVVLQRKEENLKKIVEDSLEPFLISLELKKIKYQINIASKLKIVCDKNWTIEALSNIIKNAYEHTNELGNIIISTVDNPLYTRISITDDGSGISKSEIPKIFQRFYHGNESKDSIGIGLNMSKMIIEKQKGSIEVESQLNKGTTFLVTFYKNK